MSQSPKKSLDMPSHSKPTAKIDDTPANPVGQLFGDSVGDGDDIFAQLAAEDEPIVAEQEPSIEADAHVEHPETSTGIIQVLPEDDEPDFAALIGNAATEEEAGAEAPAEPQEVSLEDRYKFLMEDFEELSPVGGDLAVPTSVDSALGQDLGGFADGTEGLHEGNEAAIRGAAAFFDDGGEGGGAFDEIIGQQSGDLLQETPDRSPIVNPSIEESPLPPDLSIEYTEPSFEQSVGGDISMVTEDSDWLADTTMDASFQIDPRANEEVDSGHQAAGEADPNEPVPFDVPEGWFDESGVFQYYTEEEREAVRAMAMGQASWDTGVLQSPVDPTSPSLPIPSYNPASVANQSENAARRTPIPEQQPSFGISSSPYDPYSQQVPTQPAPQSNPYAPAASSYDPYAPVSAPTGPLPVPTAGSYDPYAPVPQPFARPQQGGRSVSQPFAAQPPAAPKTVPPKPQRIVSNAYDPPFLRTQKSFARPASAASAAPAFSTPSPSLGMTHSTQPVAAPPPSGPPRRTPTQPPSSSLSPPNVPPSGYMPRQPSVSGTPNLASQLEDLAEEHQDPYGQPSRPPSRPPSSTTNRKTPSAPSYSAFDPPLRPTSAARSISRAPSIPAFSPPPSQAAQLPSSVAGPSPNAALAPPKPPQGPPRKSSPMFEARPPSRSLQKPAQAPSTQENESYRMSSPLPVPVAPSQQEEHDWRHRSSDEVNEADDYPSNNHGERSNESQPYQNRSPISTTSNRTLSPPINSSTNDPSSSYAPSPYQPYQPPQNPSTDAYSPYAPSQPGSEPRTSMDSHRPTPADPYAPSSYTPSESYNPYAPTPSATVNRPRQVSQPPIPVPQPQQPYQPTSWAPPVPALYQEEPTSMYSARGPSPPVQTDNYFQSMHSTTTSKDDTYVPQQVLEQKPVSEDPLGRCTPQARNIPLAVFGFGGVLITGFPASAEDNHDMGHSRTPSYGYASGRGQLWIRKLTEVISTSALHSNDTVFLGPLVLDTSASKGAAAEKKKKEGVVGYLTSRAEEIEKGLPYLKSSAKATRREEEGKLVVLRLLQAMLQGDGKLSGSPAVEESIRTALQNPSSASSSPLATASAPSVLSASVNAPTRSSAASPQQLRQLSDMIVGGNKQGAASFAADHGLWSHALVIASSADPELWKDMVARFAEAELASVPNAAALRASYTLFAGKLENVDDLVAACNITNDPSADQWREVLSAIVFNGNAAQLSCLDEFGNRLMALGLINAAQACYLLSPTSPFGDVTVAAFDKPIMLTQNPKDEDAIIFAEIAEYARSLISVPKGQEPPFPGLPTLLPYKLQRAWLAAELGETDRAQRYCNAVEAAGKIKNGQNLLSGHLSASLEDLMERLTGSPSADPSKGFGSRKSTSKAGISSWIEGRLTKFIAGDDDTTAAQAKPIQPVKNQDAPIGPFSHFSTISPAPSMDISRNGSYLDIPGTGNGILHPSGGSSRTSPVFSQHSTSNQNSPQGRPSALGSADTSMASNYGGYMGSRGGDDYNSWSNNHSNDNDNMEDDDATPPVHADDGDFINPMAALSIGPTATTNNYEPKQNARVYEDDDEDDLGFGNAALSRNRTPRPAETQDTNNESNKAADTAKPAKAEPAAAAPSGKLEPQKSSSWLGKWWGKKEGEGSGPIRAKLGEESSMVYDPDLKRWIVKGSKPDAAAATPPPPPPRSQSTTPAASAAASPNVGSATPPQSRLSQSAGPGSSSGMSRSSTAPMGFADGESGPSKARSNLAESITPRDVPPPAGSAPPRPATGGPPPRPANKALAAPSIDDLLSRPPSKRPGAKKGAKNRYVDVFQPGAEGS